MTISPRASLPLFSLTVTMRRHLGCESCLPPTPQLAPPSLARQLYKSRESAGRARVAPPPPWRYHTLRRLPMQTTTTPIAIPLTTPRSIEGESVWRTEVCIPPSVTSTPRSALSRAPHGAVASESAVSESAVSESAVPRVSLSRCAPREPAALLPEAPSSAGLRSVRSVVSADAA